MLAVSQTKQTTKGLSHRQMNKVNDRTFRFDGIKWLFIVALLATAVVGNYYLVEVASYYRALGVVLMLVVSLLIASQTAKGHRAWLFLQEARAELRRVVWPTRPETVQATLVVLGMVFVMSILLWIIDAILFRVMTLFTGG